jgi:hypothetical protein
MLQELLLYVQSPLVNDAFVMHNFRWRTMLLTRAYTSLATNYTESQYQNLLTVLVNFWD